MVFYLKNNIMRKLFVWALAFIPLVGLTAIQDWDYLPFISYSGEYPGNVIKEGKNFDFLHNLWEKPKSLDELKSSDFIDVDTIQLLNQGMVYKKDDVYYSAIPFIDSVATEKLRAEAKLLAARIINDTRQEREAFFTVLDSAGYRDSAFPLVHSFVFDDIIWEHIGVTQKISTIHPTDSMTWSGIFYFYRPENLYQYGTNGVGLGDNNTFKFAWGINSNAYLCTAFIRTNILKALGNILNGEDLTEEMLQDCEEYGVLDGHNRLTIPILDGQDEISKAANKWATSAAESFTQHFDANSVAETIGWNCTYNEASLKVILYHEVLTQISNVLDENGLLQIPEILTSKTPANKKQTASVGYITTR